MLNGDPYHHPTPKRSISMGLGMITEDRKTEGLVQRMSIRENAALSPFAPIHGAMGVIQTAKERMLATESVRNYSIKCESIQQEVLLLSGGNQQKVVLAKWLATAPRVLILDEPTAGLDPVERIRFRNLISELSENRIVILSTHIVSDVEYIAKDIWLMKDGKILQQGNLDEIVSSMPQKVWACQTSHEKAAKLMKQYKVSNMKSENGTVELRIISARQPLEHARLVRPNLEDVFLYYFGEKGGDME